jgi:cation diffusion facilitator CzcD-associated flavoprotein CzcO
MIRARRTPTVAILGAGAAGLVAGIRLKQAGIEGFRIFEKSHAVGGTWHDNTYPGAACDILSHLYSFSFELKPDWSRSYATQPEIRAYLEHCVDAYGLRPHLRLDTAIAEARWDDAACAWHLRTERGEEVVADVVVSALGMLNVPAHPSIPGLADFAGPCFHSARWDHGVDLSGKRVAAIGTGASAIQFVPAIAPIVGRLEVFQRSPAWILPKLDRPYSEAEQRRFARVPLAARLHRWKIYWTYERNTSFRIKDPGTAERTRFARSHLERKVRDPALRAALTPDYPIGCKRILVSNDFYEAIASEPVRLVTAPIERITEKTIVTSDGVEHEADVIVLGTGFKATEFLASVDFHGRKGRRLRDDWSDGAQAYLGMAVSGYPNLFAMYGPNTNQGGNSILFLLEAQAHYIARAVRGMARRWIASLEVRRSAMDRYNRSLEAALRGTVWEGSCGSYFKTATGRITTQLPHSSLWYWAKTRRPRWGDFEQRPLRADARAS